jgi:hypothetical protein
MAAMGIPWYPYPQKNGEPVGATNRVSQTYDTVEKPPAGEFLLFPIHQTEYRGDMPRGNKSFWASNWRQDQIE